MDSPLRILHLEDAIDDADMIHRTLQKQGVLFTVQTVVTEQQFLAAMARGDFDIILSDYNLSGFNGMSALRITLGNRPEVPFIFVSGSIGEDLAIDALKSGATDYILKDRPARLGKAIERALHIKQSEAALRTYKSSLSESEETFRQLAETINEIFFIVGLGGSPILYISPMYEEVWGCSCESLYKNPFSWLDIVHPDDRARVESLVRSKLEGAVFEYRLLRTDGSVRHIRARTFPVRKKAGEVTKLVGIAEDITERKAAEEALREKSRLALLMAQVATGLTRENSLQEILTACAASIVANLDAAFARVWTLNEETQVLELQASAGMYTHLDGPHSRVPVGKFKIGLIAQERKPHLTNDVLNDPRVGDKEWARREGMVSFAGYPLLIGERVVGVMAMFARKPLTDFTLKALGAISDTVAISIDRMHARFEIAKKELQYRRLFEASKDGILILDGVTGQITDCNPSLSDLLGYSIEELMGKEVWEIGPFKSIVASKSAFSILREKEYMRFENLLMDAKDGTSVTVEFTSNSYSVNEKRVMQCNIRDITERQRLESQLRQSQKLEGVGQLAGGIAHDFNNLLTVINGRSQLMMTRFKPGDRMRDNLELIYKTGERAAALTGQLLAFSRQQVLNPTILDLNGVAADMDKMLRRLIREDINLVTVLDPVLKRVKADRGQLEQVIMNLVVNARDAMPGGGKLTIETTNVELSNEYCHSRTDVKSGPYVMLAVSDTGHGMDATVKGRIFEPFFTTKPLGKGTGLGLATVFGVVKQSNGHIEVYSEVGKGTTFKIYLPQSHEKPTASASESQLTVPVGQEVILVVEDEEGVRELVRDLLEMNGYTVLLATNGREALSICAAHNGTINLIVTDVVMPEMGGPELVRHIRISHPNTKVLFSSGYTDNAIVRNGELEAGVAFIQKPFTPANFARKVREVLDKAT